MSELVLPSADNFSFELVLFFFFFAGSQLRFCCQYFFSVFYSSANCGDSRHGFELILNLFIFFLYLSVVNYSQWYRFFLGGGVTQFSVDRALTSTDLFLIYGFFQQTSLVSDFPIVIKFFIR